MTDDKWQVEYEFTVVQDDDEVAGGNGPDRAAILREAHHYAAVFRQDGPVEVLVWEVAKRCIYADGVPND